MLEDLRDNLISAGVVFPIYMDYQSTTPMDKRVLQAMMPYFMDKFGNPHSRNHQFGWEAEEAVEAARTEVAKVIGARTKEIYFTSGATESNNLALTGAARFYKNKKRHIITISTEHKCILSTAKYLQLDGIDVTYLGVESNGIIDLDKLRSAIRDDTMMVSIMAVNNEIGVIQPIKDIGRMCRESGILFHSDIAQAFGKIPINVDECNIDLASISSHKIYGPKGIGALYIRHKPRVRLAPIMHGGGQERGVRSGTVPTPRAVGFGEAARLAVIEMDRDYAHVKALSDKFINMIMMGIQDVYLNGDSRRRYPGNINMSFAYVEGESLMMAIKDIAVSSGSACTSASLEPSYVLKAIGIEADLAHTSLRFGIGRFTTDIEVEYAAFLIADKVAKLRDMSPLWEMAQEGINIKQMKWSASH